MAVRNRILGYTGSSYLSYQNLQVRHNRGDVIWGGWGALDVSFAGCDFFQLGQNGIQYHNGSTGRVDASCTFTDWGIANGQNYAVHVIGYSGTASGPILVDDSVFTITHSENTTEIGAVMCDQMGNLESFQRNTCTGTGGNWARDAVTVWRPQGMTVCTIADNTFTDIGGIPIAVQELEYYGDTPAVDVARNTLDGACLEDRIDTEALRLRDFTTACIVRVFYNLINGTTDGANDHHGIRLTDAQGVELYHNTVSGCDDGLKLENGGTRDSTATAKNNISPETGAMPSTSSLERSPRTTTTSSARWRASPETSLL